MFYAVFSAAARGPKNCRAPGNGLSQPWPYPRPLHIPHFGEKIRRTSFREAFAVAHQFGISSVLVLT